MTSDQENVMKVVLQAEGIRDRGVNLPYGNGSLESLRRNVVYHLFTMCKVFEVMTITAALWSIGTISLVVLGVIRIFFPIAHLGYNLYCFFTLIITSACGIVHVIYVWRAMFHVNLHIAHRDLYIRKLCEKDIQQNTEEDEEWDEEDWDEEDYEGSF